MNTKLLPLPLLLLLAAGGCTVYYDEPPPRRHVVYRERVVSPAPQDPIPAGDPPPVAQEMTETEEVNEVVYREYYGATDEEIVLLPYYRHYYALTDDDIYFIYFVSCRSGISFDVCFHSYYYDCGRNYDRLVVTYNVPREHFFIAVGAGVSYPPVYQRSYSCYHNGTYTSVTFTNTEYVALVRMRVACDYQGHPPTTYFARVQATGSPSRVIVESKDQCGRGGHTVVGAKVSVTATRGWTLPPQQRQEYHAQHQQAAVKAEGTFKEHHADQVQKVQARPAASPGKAPAAGATHPKPSGGAAPGEHPPANPATGPAHPRPEGQPVEKHPPEHPQPDKKAPPPEEHEKKGEKDKDK
jgi:hypothetical protein